MDLYYAPTSPPCRAVRLAARALGIDLNLKLINAMAGEHLTEEYAQLSPEKRIPLLVDDDFKISESRAIMIYLFEKCGGSDSLYPSDPDERALVNHALHFDIGILYKAVTEFYFPVIFKKEEQFSKDKYEKLKDAFSILNKMLEDRDYVAGKYLTLADFSVIQSVILAEIFGFLLDDYERVMLYSEVVRLTAPGFAEIMSEGHDILAGMSENLQEAQKQFLEEDFQEASDETNAEVSNDGEEPQEEPEPQQEDEDLAKEEETEEVPNEEESKDEMQEEEENKE